MADLQNDILRIIKNRCEDFRGHALSKAAAQEDYYGGEIRKKG